MFHIAICDDSPHQNRMIQSLLSEYQLQNPHTPFQVHSFVSADTLLESMEAQQAYDLLLLDIIMPGLSGLELAQKLRDNNENVPIVFLTSSADYALSAFKVSAMQYILKPIDENELFAVLDKVLALYSPKKDQHFVLALPNRILTIPFSSIAYVENTRRIIKVYLENGEELESKTLRIPFQKAIAPLLADQRFLNPHMSFVLNMEHVQELNGKTFVMQNGGVIPIPRYKFTEIKGRYLDFLMQNGLCY